MTSLKSVWIFPLVVATCLGLGCTNESAKAPDVAGSVRQGLDQANLKDVSVSQDRDKNVVTLSGKVASDSDKAQAESITKSIVGTEVVSNQIAVRPPGDEGTARKVDSDLDKGIDKNLDAMLVQHKMDKDVRYDVNNGVVTLKGNVTSQTKRESVAKMAGDVPNVKQVVNEIEVKGQKATSSR